MLLTDDFVFIHLPKTGGTFVGDAIRRLYPSGFRRARQRVFGPSPVGRRARDHIHVHAPRHLVPPTHRSHGVLATIRSPYEHHVSAYEFGEWKKAESNPDFSRHDWPRIRKEFTDFPGLSFADYLKVFARVGYRIGQEDRPELGWTTVRFAWQFTLDDPPDATSDHEAIIDAIEHRTNDIRFVHTENLNNELHGAFLEIGLPAEAIAFIPDAPKLLPTKGGRTPDQHWTRYYTDDLLGLVRKIEAPMFARFPEYDT